MMADPIFVDCRGGGHPGYLFDDGWMMCAICGWQTEYPEPDMASDGVVPEHQRKDLSAMVERGDFDG